MDLQATALTKARYRRLAPVYDFMEGMAERRYMPWRRKLWKLVRSRLPVSSKFLEVGVGTGKNMPYWPAGVDVVGIDLTPEMLARAVRKAGRDGRVADLALGDVQALRFGEGSFDLAAATFVFCSVPDPILGLQELKRVVRPGGSVVLMEHVRSQRPLLGKMMDLLAPLVVRVMGAHINRETVSNVAAAGLEIVSVEDLGLGGIFKLIHAKVPA